LSPPSSSRRASSRSAQGSTCGSIPLPGGLTAADLDAVIPAAPDGVVLPKCLDGADVQRLGANLAVREAEHGLADGSTRIIAIATESARALFGFASYRGAGGRLEGLAWGGEDLAADLGAETNRLPDGAYAAPYALARTLTLVGAVAAGARPIDAVYLNFRDLDGLRTEALAARRDGLRRQDGDPPGAGSGHQRPILHLVRGDCAGAGDRRRVRRRAGRRRRRARRRDA